jgi:hypothetical protein
MILRYLLPALVASLLLGSPARADYQFQFADSSGNPGSGFTINSVGSTVAIQVYLLQTNTGTSNTLTTNGLVDGGLALQFSSTAPFTISSTSNITPNTAQFGGTNNTSLTTSGGTTTATLQVHNNTPVVAPTSGANANRILLGTFTFTGVSSGSAITVTAFPDPGSANNIDGAGNNLDGFISQSQAAITVVPEPSTLVLTGLLAVGGLTGAAWRRYRRCLA